MHQSPFDNWVEEAPFRHLGVFAVVILAVVAILVGGCAPNYTYRCEAYAKHVTTQYVHFHGGAVEKSVTTTDVCVKETAVTVY
jgi:hypothetical protein